ncbi:hypothetical protein PAPYR_4231 [Paratrimastix pyriformis]|uniref:Uncharacterized protein n=1 Tax=Paratrimastix pyriformis TaxID=342808 RepID=A0ABQ8UP71_9EUKA|nr:hypothetical protein PAPYR_4231 [Paratrimastix pyriformis]
MYFPRVGITTNQAALLSERFQRDNRIAYNFQKFGSGSPPRQRPAGLSLGGSIPTPNTHAGPNAAGLTRDFVSRGREELFSRGSTCSSCTSCTSCSSVSGLLRGLAYFFQSIFFPLFRQAPLAPARIAPIRVQTAHHPARRVPHVLRVLPARHVFLP